MAKNKKIYQQSEEEKKLAAQKAAEGKMTTTGNGSATPDISRRRVTGQTVQVAGKNKGSGNNNNNGNTNGQNPTGKKTWKGIVKTFIVVSLVATAIATAAHTGISADKAGKIEQNLKETEITETAAETTEVVPGTEKESETEKEPVVDAPSDEKETNGPEDTSKPEETKGPEDTAGPSETVKPEDTNKPEDTKEPEETKGPEDTNGPANPNGPSTPAEDVKLEVGQQAAVEAQLYFASRPYITCDTASIKLLKIENNTAIYSLNETPKGKGEVSVVYKIEYDSAVTKDTLETAMPKSFKKFADIDTLVQDEEAKKQIEQTLSPAANKGEVYVCINGEQDLTTGEMKFTVESVGVTANGIEENKMEEKGLHMNGLTDAGVLYEVCDVKQSTNQNATTAVKPFEDELIR